MTEPTHTSRGATDIPAVFTPENEPYAGRAALFRFDQILIVLAAEQRRIGARTHCEELTALQRAASELAPAACSIAFSIRELVRQGYLLPVLILIRPLVERVSTLAYLVDREDAVSLWNAGWPHKTRPSLAARLAALGGPDNIPDAGVTNSLDALRSSYNGLIHGDPASAGAGAILLPDGTAGFTTGKDLASPARADDVCTQASTYTMVLTVKAAEVFPPKA